MSRQEVCFVPGNCLALARHIGSMCSHEQISVPLIRFVRQHLWTPWFRWMIRDDSVQNSDLMQAVSTQDSSILDDESFRQFRFVAFQVVTHSEPNVIIAMHKVRQEFATMGEDACTEHPLFKVMIQEMITDTNSKACPASRISYQPRRASKHVSSGSLAQVQRRNHHAEHPHAGKLCLRPETVKHIRDADGASLTCFLDNQTTPKLRSLLSSLVTVNPPHPARLPSHSLIRFCPGRDSNAFSLQAKSISDFRAAAVPTGSSSRPVYWS